MSIGLCGLPFAALRQNDRGKPCHYNVGDRLALAARFFMPLPYKLQSQKNGSPTQGSRCPIKNYALNNDFQLGFLRRHAHLAIKRQRAVVAFPDVEGDVV